MKLIEISFLLYPHPLNEKILLANTIWITLRLLEIVTWMSLVISRNLITRNLRKSPEISKLSPEIWEKVLACLIKAILILSLSTLFLRCSWRNGIWWKRLLIRIIISSSHHICLYVCLSIHQSVYMSVCVYICLFVILFVCQYVSLSVRLSPCLSPPVAPKLVTGFQKHMVEWYSFSSCNDSFDT